MAEWVDINTNDKSLEQIPDPDGITTMPHPADPDNQICVWVDLTGACPCGTYASVAAASADNANCILCQ